MPSEKNMGGDESPRRVIETKEQPKKRGRKKKSDIIEGNNQ